MIYLVIMACSDYYCDGQHPVGAYTTKEAADEALTLANRLPRFRRGGAAQYIAYECGGKIVTIPFDEPPAVLPGEW